MDVAAAEAPLLFFDSYGAFGGTDAGAVLVGPNLREFGAEEDGTKWLTTSKSYAGQAG